MNYSHPDPEDLFGAIGNMTLGELTVAMAEVASLLITDQLRVEIHTSAGVVKQIRPDSPALRPLVEALEDHDIAVMGYDEQDDDEEFKSFLKEVMEKSAKEAHPSSQLDSDFFSGENLPEVKWNLGTE